MDFSVWTREKPMDEFKPLATAQVEFEGGPKSIDIVQRGLNEAQIRTVSRQIEQLADRLTASGASTKDPARQAGFTALVMATANAILKELGFPPLSSNR